MNFSTIIGFTMAVAVFVAATLGSPAGWETYLDWHATVIVVGGSIAATSICFPLPKVLGLTRVFLRRILGRNRFNYAALIEEIVSLAQASRRGRPAFEQAIGKVNDLFLKDAAQVLFWLDAEISHEDLRDLLETRAETHYERYLNEAEIFRVMSKFPPAFGLMGTTMGMIALLQALGSASSRGNIGPAMSVALVATLYGIVGANFILIPIAENLTLQTRDDLVARRIVVEGVMLIAADKPSQFVEEKVKSFLLPSERGKIRPARRGGGGSSAKAA